MEKIFLDHPWIIILILLWTLPWKGAALWRAARRGHLGWFLTLIILNTLGILDILYIVIFSNWGMRKKQVEQDKQPKQQEIKKQEINLSQTKFSSSQNSRLTIV